MNMTLWGYFLLYVLVFPVWAVLHGRRERQADWFHPVTFTFLIIMLTVGWRIPYAVYYATPLLDADSVFEQGLLSITCFFLAGILVYYAARPFFAPSIEFSVRFQSVRGMCVAMLICYGVGIAFVALLIANYGGVTGVMSDVSGFMSEGFQSSWSLVLGYRITQVCSCAAFLLWVYSRESRMGLLALCLIGVTMIIGVTGGYRSYVFNVLLYCTIAWSCAVRSVRTSVIVCLCALVLLVTPSLNELRFGSEWPPNLSLRSLWASAQFGVGHLINSVGSRFIGLDAHCRAWDMLMRGEVPVEHGRRFIEYPLTLVPRILLPSKPSVVGVEMTDVFFSDVYPSGTGTTMSVMAFLFWQFGWIGAACSPLLFGVLLAWITKWYEETPRTYGNVYVYTVAFIEFILSLWQFDLTSITRLMIAIVLTLPLVRIELRRKVDSVEYIPWRVASPGVTST
jgi:hypothetical protein